MHGSRLRCAEEDRSAGARCKGSAFAQYAFCLVAYDRDWLRLAVDVGGRKTGSSSDKYAVSSVGTSLGSVVARVRVCEEKGTRGPISDLVGQMMIVTGTDQEMLQSSVPAEKLALLVVERKQQMCS